MRFSSAAGTQELQTDRDRAAQRHQFRNRAILYQGYCDRLEKICALFHVYKEHALVARLYGPGFHETIPFRPVCREGLLDMTRLWTGWVTSGGNPRVWHVAKTGRTCLPLRSSSLNAIMMLLQTQGAALLAAPPAGAVEESCPADLLLFFTGSHAPTMHVTSLANYRLANKWWFDAFPTHGRSMLALDGEERPMAATDQQWLDISQLAKTATTSHVSGAERQHLMTWHDTCGPLDFCVKDGFVTFCRYVYARFILESCMRVQTAAHPTDDGSLDALACLRYGHQGNLVFFKSNCGLLGVEIHINKHKTSGTLARASAEARRNCASVRLHGFAESGQHSPWHPQPLLAGQRPSRFCICRLISVVLAQQALRLFSLPDAQSRGAAASAHDGFAVTSAPPSDFGGPVVLVLGAWCLEGTGHNSEVCIYVAARYHEAPDLLLWGPSRSQAWPMPPFNPAAAASRPDSLEARACRSGFAAARGSAVPVWAAACCIMAHEAVNIYISQRGRGAHCVATFVPFAGAGAAP